MSLRADVAARRKELWSIHKRKAFCHSVPLGTQGGVRCCSAGGLDTLLACFAALRSCCIRSAVFQAQKSGYGTFGIVLPSLHSLHK